MLFLKRIVTVLALVYLLLTLLILFFPFVRSSTVGIFSVYSLPMEINMLLGFAWASVGIVGLLLVFENLDSGLLRRKVAQQDTKINELKAQLFDQRAPTTSPLAPATGSAVSYPTATQYPRPDASAPDSASSVN
ncbi:MAG: hypothetical protein ACRYFK_20925 [Janthinobacterium lividum]